MFRILALTLFCAFLCGCNGPTRQDTQTDTNTAPAITVVNAGNTDDGSFTAALSLSQPADSPAVANARPRINVRLQNGMTYEGEWSNGRANGQGVVTDANGTRQEGEWRDGVPYRIQGKSVFPDGTIEVGTWNYDGTLCGGTINWPDGRQYKGDWKLTDNAPELPDGEGEMTFPDGSKYAGQFHDGTMDGLGKMTYPDGKVVLGVWKHDKFMSPAP